MLCRSSFVLSKLFFLEVHAYHAYLARALVLHIRPFFPMQTYSHAHVYVHKTYAHTYTHAHMHIYFPFSPGRYMHCANITIYDTPGFRLGGDERIRSDILSMVRRIMEPSNRIIVCLEQSTVEWANTTSRPIVREIDRDFSRTVLINTKFDNRVKVKRFRVDFHCAHTRARARVCVCVCLNVRTCLQAISFGLSGVNENVFVCVFA